MHLIGTASVVGKWSLVLAEETRPFVSLREQRVWGPAVVRRGLWRRFPDWATISMNWFMIHCRSRQTYWSTELRCSPISRSRLHFHRRVRRSVPERVPIEGRENWQAVLDGMDRVVNGLHGTARDVAVGAHYRTAGKTGTAQVYGLGVEEEYDEETVARHLRHHALFIGFAPVEAPRIVVAVVIEHGGAGSRVAAPVARATLDAWLEQELPRGVLP